MFDTLSDKLQSVLGDLRSRGTLDEETISRAMREIRLALLEADVNLDVVKDFVAPSASARSAQEVPKSLTPGQQVVKIVHEELTELMGWRRLAARVLGAAADGDPPRRAPGLGQDDRRRQARAPAEEGRSLAASRRRRPPAAGGDRRSSSSSACSSRSRSASAERTDPVAATRAGIEQARTQGRDVVILDTAGRLHIDDALMDELAARPREAKPTNVLLVLDAMTGQEAVNVATAFQERVDFDGVLLTKLDGDARGGAALSVKSVTGKPIKLASVGEKLDQLEVFHPDRMASRILGMGDVLTLIERAEEVAEIEDTRGDGAAHDRGRVHLRRLPPELQDDAEDGAAPGRPQDDPGHGQAARGPRPGRRRRARPGRGDHPLDDAARAAPART